MVYQVQHFFPSSQKESPWGLHEGRVIHKGAPALPPWKREALLVLPDKPRVQRTAADWADAMEASFWSHCGEKPVRPLWLWELWAGTSRNTTSTLLGSQQLLLLNMWRNPENWTITHDQTFLFHRHWTVYPPEQTASCPHWAEFYMCTHSFGIWGQK